MVYDFKLGKEYKLDVNELSTFIRDYASKTFPSQNEFDFFYGWIQVILDAFSNNLNRISGAKCKSSQIFQKEIVMGTQKVLLHYQVDVLEELLSAHETPHRYNIDTLLSKGLMYTYEPNKTTNDIESPIYIVQLPWGLYNAFVADGNHRLSSKIIDKCKIINAYIVPPEIAVISLMSKFEQCIYGLLMDFYRIKNVGYAQAVESSLTFFHHLQTLSREQH